MFLMLDLNTFYHVETARIPLRIYGDSLVWVWKSVSPPNFTLKLLGDCLGGLGAAVLRITLYF